MGFFSSLGGILGGVAGSIISPGLGTVIGAGLGSTVGGGIDSNQANKTTQGYYNSQMNLARQQMQFQQDYAKSVMQWRVEDAKKAGVHPMAALGMSNPSYSPVSLPSIPSSAGIDASFNPMEFGQSLNYAATKAKDRQQQAQMVGLQMRGLELDNEFKQAQIDALKVDTLASSIASDQALSSPASPPVNNLNPVGDPASPFMDKPIIRDGWLLDEKGRKISIIPSDALKGRTEDVLGVEWLPFIGSAYRDAKARMIGHEVNGHWWHGLDKGYLPYPPKRKGGPRVKVSSYYDNSYRY